MTPAGPPARVLLLADTHLGGSRPGRRLPDAVVAAAVDADAIVHAGDVTDGATLDRLAAAAPLHAVRGNNDVGLTLPDRLEVELGGCRVAAVHDSGPAAGRADRLRRWFPDADVVVFGHSHLPWHEIDRRASDGHRQHHVNPGSPTERRRAPHPTLAWLELAGGTVLSVRHVAIDGAGGAATVRGGSW